MLHKILLVSRKAVNKLNRDALFKCNFECVQISDTRYSHGKFCTLTVLHKYHLYHHFVFVTLQLTSVALTSLIRIMDNPFMPHVADFRDISHFPLFPFLRLKNLAEKRSEGHLVRLPSQETVVSTSMRLLWLYLSNCVEFPSFQTRDICSSATLFPLGKKVFPSVRCKPSRRLSSF